MKLTQIEIKENQIRSVMEENRDGSYSILIEKLDENGAYESGIASFRTDEITIDSLIEILTFLKNYNFIQK